jgi:putative membrane protein
MRRWPKLLIWFVIIFHFAAFVLEAFLWMQPGIYQAVLPRLTNRASPPALEQALVLRALFVNQGFYNLFLALAGVSGMVLSRRGHRPAGHALCCYMCLSALGAGIVLALSTRAYAGAFLQAVPSAVALVLMWQRVDEPERGPLQETPA